MNVSLMMKALKRLDEKLSESKLGKAQILIGGGSAFALAYRIPIQTADIDGVLFKCAVDHSQLDPLVKAVGRDLKIAGDWLNPYFETFLFCLPPDYGDRLKNVYQGNSLKAVALGPTDLLIMKCFAGREKDLLHAKWLVKKGADLSFAETHIRSLMDKSVPGASAALDFLFDVEDQVME